MVGNFQKKQRKLYSWVCNHPQVVYLPLTHGCVNIKFNTTGVFINK